MIKRTDGDGEAWTASPPPAKLLLVDDEPSTLLAMQAVLEPLGPEIVTAASGAGALRRLLEDDFALILLDVRLPDIDGFEIARLIRQRQRSRQIPIIFVTGFREEEYLQKGYHAGGVDILFKPVIPEVLRSKVSVFLDLHRKSALLEAHAAELALLNAGLERRVQERTAELKRSNEELHWWGYFAFQMLEALREASERLKLHFQNSPLGIVEWDPDFRVLRWNREATRMFGWTAEEVIGQRIGQIRWVHEEDAPRVHRWMAEMVAGKRPRNVTSSRNYRRDGAVIDCEWYNSALLDGSGKLRSVLSFVLNVTERKRTEEQIRQIQRLESLGVLAGGVAHDFNNLLTGIVGNASLVLEDMPAVDKSRPLVQCILRAGESAAHLTAQLLAYAGKGQFTLGPVSLSQVIEGMSELLRRSLPQSVRLEFDLAEDLPGVEADSGQMSQVAMNLIVNGAEAIRDGEPGVVRVCTGVREVTPDEGWIGCDGCDLPFGEYVCLEVSDTGCGIDESSQARIFEPFFTTKFLGRGLGLAAVHGIVRNHKGAIRVRSAVGEGSRFTVLLPALN